MHNLDSPEMLDGYERYVLNMGASVESWSVTTRMEPQDGTGIYYIWNGSLTVNVYNQDGVNIDVFTFGDRVRDEDEALSKVAQWHDRGLVGQVYPRANDE